MCAIQMNPLTPAGRNQYKTPRLFLITERRTPHMAKKDEQNQSQNQEAQAPDVLDVAAPNPDAKHYVDQPTSYRLPVSAQAIGGVPEGRFTEEVLKGGDEEDSSTTSWEAHPEHNQPVMGISGDEDELPDTTGRAALRAQKRNS